MALISILEEHLLTQVPSSNVGHFSSLKRRPSCHTLSNALEISKNVLLTWRYAVSSKVAWILWTIDKTWFTQELLGWKPNRFRVSELLLSYFQDIKRQDYIYMYIYIYIYIHILYTYIYIYIYILESWK